MHPLDCAPWKVEPIERADTHELPGVALIPTRPLRGRPVPWHKAEDDR
jgi:hypothetical protein